MNLCPSDPLPGTVLEILVERSPRAVQGAWFTMTLQAPELGGLKGLHQAVRWAARIASNITGDPEHILAIRLDEAACMAELDVGSLLTRPHGLH